MDSGRPNVRMGITFWISLSWLAAVFLLSAAAGRLPIPAPDEMDWSHPSVNPGTASETAILQTTGERTPSRYTYWLGTDTMGRDLVSRLIYGARISLSVGFTAPLIGLLIGGSLGCIAGYYRGTPGSLITGAMDIILAFPGIVLLLAVAFYLGVSLQNLILCLGFLSIPAFCRVARAKTLALSNLEFVQAARLTGAGNWTILFREIAPNVMVPLAVYALMVAAFMIMAEGSLSFLGLGIAAPTPSWGGMIADGREVLDEAPHVSMIPATTLFLTVLSLNLMGDHLRNHFERSIGQI